MRPRPDGPPRDFTRVDAWTQWWPTVVVKPFLVAGRLVQGIRGSGDPPLPPFLLAAIEDSDYDEPPPLIPQAQLEHSDSNEPPPLLPDSVSENDEEPLPPLDLHLPID